MSTPMPNCWECGDTGSLSKNIDGQLDCGHCGVATKRAALNEWCRKNIEYGASKSAAAWLIYQHGHADGDAGLPIFG